MSLKIEDSSMKLRASWLFGLATAGVFGISGSAFGQADVIVGDLAGPGNPGGAGPRYVGSSGTIGVYSIGTTSCNIGNVPLNWFSNGTDHPAIIYNMYRLDNGRFEHIGVSWVKHGFCALQQTACGPCTPTGSGCRSTLGVGCSDPYSSSLNSSQSGLGPRSDINPSQVGWPWPFTTDGQTGPTTYKRMIIERDEIDPAIHPGAQFFGEGQYIAKDDKNAGNSHNNASYRRVGVNSSVGSGGWYLNWLASTTREDPAIFAWRDHGLGPNTPDPDVTLVPVDVPNDGRYWVGYKVSDNGDGTYHYEYAVFNLDSDRAGRYFRVDVGNGATISNNDFHSPEYNGEIFDNTPWGFEIDANGRAKWSSPQSHSQNPNTNALRFGTLYNFAFDSDGAPVEGNARLQLFKSGTPGFMTINVLVPGDVGVTCTDDWNGDTLVNTGDFLAYLGDYSDVVNGGTWTYNNPDIVEPLDSLNTADFLEYLNWYSNGCP